MPKLFVTVCALVVAVLAVSSSAQQRTFRNLAATLPMSPAPVAGVAADGRGGTEFVVGWERIGVAGDLMTSGDPSPADRLTLLSQRVTSSGPSRQRQPSPAPDDLIVIFRDRQGIERGWQIVADPRVVRSEQPSATGELRGQTFYRRDAQLVVPAPGTIAAATLEILQPQWNGQDFVLMSIGMVAVGTGGGR